MVTVCRIGVLLSFFGLFALLLLDLAWLAPPEATPRALAMLLICGPLLFALRGVLHRRPYTHAWLSLLALIYFAVTFSDAFGGREPIAWLQAAASLGLFVFSAYFVRYEQRRLRALAAAPGQEGPASPPG